MLARESVPYRYTQTELEELLDSLTILIDTREKEVDHILAYLDKFDINYRNKKLDYGDYSFMLPENKELGIVKPVYFDDQLVIERKASLEELSGNLTQKRQRFENELLRGSESKFILLVEDPEGYENIINHNYRTKFQPKAFVASLMTFQHRYDIDIKFMDPSYTGQFIALTAKYYLREYLK